MCDPLSVAVGVGALGYMDHNRKKADKAKNKAEMDAEKDQKKMEKQKAKADLKFKTDEANASQKAQQDRLEKEGLFKKYGYRGTFGTSGGGLGLTNPASGQKKQLLGGA